MTTILSFDQTSTQIPRRKHEQATHRNGNAKRSGYACEFLHAGAIRALSITNTAAATRSFKLYNKASAPTVGTDVPVKIITTSTDVTITTLIATDVSTAQQKYPVNDITTSTTLGSYALYTVSSASNLTLTLPAPTAGRSIKVAVRTAGTNGHRVYPAAGHVIYWSGMYSTSYDTFNAQPSGIGSGQACLLRPGLYEFVGVSSTEWTLSSTPKMYS